MKKSSHNLEKFVSWYKTLSETFKDHLTFSSCWDFQNIAANTSVVTPHPKSEESRNVFLEYLSEIECGHSIHLWLADKRQTNL